MALVSGEERGGEGPSMEWLFLPLWVVISDVGPIEPWHL